MQGSGMYYDSKTSTYCCYDRPTQQYQYTKRVDSLKEKPFLLLLQYLETNSDTAADSTHGNSAELIHCGTVSIEDKTQASLDNESSIPNVNESRLSGTKSITCPPETDYANATIIVKPQLTNKEPSVNEEPASQSKPVSVVEPPRRSARASKSILASIRDCPVKSPKSILTSVRESLQLGSETGSKNSFSDLQLKNVKTGVTALESGTQSSVALLAEGDVNMPFTAGENRVSMIRDIVVYTNDK